MSSWGELGRALLAALEQHRQRRALPRRVLAEQLAISPAYLSQLFSGDKPVAGLALDTLRRCAQFLQLPLVRCLVLSGHLQAKDFIGPERTEDEFLRDALAVVEGSAWARAVAVTAGQLAASPRAVQWLLVRLYESAEQVCLTVESSMYCESGGVEHPCCPRPSGKPRAPAK